MRTKLSVRAVALVGQSTQTSATELTFDASRVACVNRWLSNMVIRNASHGRDSLTVKH
jgi:hypothetical protein